MSHEIQDFDRDVVERSRTTPVVVDFWAEWCGPCRMLGPVLERMAETAGEAWVLAKVDVDQNQEVARTYQIQGIPAVKLFIDGEVVAEFTGALPEAQIQQWLAQHLPDEHRSQFAEAIELIRAGEVEQGRAQLEALATQEPAGGSADVVLAQLSMFDDPEAARERVSQVSAASEHHETVADIRAITAVLLADPGDAEEHAVREDYLGAVEALREQDFAAALEGFIGVLGRHKGYQEGGARKVCIALFNYFGRKHELSNAYRRRFQSALN